MIVTQLRGHFPREAAMVHLHPDYPEPLREIEKPRGCSGNLWLGLVFLLMFLTMITWEIAHAVRRGETTDFKKPLGGGVFGLCADNQLNLEKPPTNNGQILIGTGKGNPVVSDLAGTPNQVVITNGVGSITIETNQGTLVSSPGQEMKTTC